MKKPKEPGSCIFCEGRPVTSEHMWPQWIGALLPPLPGEPQTHTHVMTTTEAGPGFVTFRPKIHQARGPMQSRKIRKVCGGKCNGGWMSQLEQAASRVMAPMIRGEEVSLGASDLRGIANWAILTSIIGEYTDIPMQAISKEDRLQLMESWIARNETRSERIPDLPAGWRVCIASQNAASWRLGYSHTGLVSGRPGEPIPTTCNSQSTTFGMGCLLIHATSTYVAAVPSNQFATTELVEIWPRVPDHLQWPRPYAQSEADVDWIARDLFRQLANGLPATTEYLAQKARANR